MGDSGQRLSSTTTRIKTLLELITCSILVVRQRLSSTTTRIKTSEIDFTIINILEVRDYLPLQQGLRQFLECLTVVRHSTVRDYLPLQQGLRQNIFIPMDNLFIRVRDYLPLQQGLRPSSAFLRRYMRCGSETIFHYNKD